MAPGAEKALTGLSLSEVKRVAVQSGQGLPDPLITAQLEGGKVSLVNPGFLNHWFGHSGKWARETGPGHWAPVERPMLGDHLEGNITAGVYQLAQDDTVKWVCFDVDTPDMGPVMELMGRLRPPYIVENTGGRGRHVWVFFEEPAPAGAVRTWARYIARDLMPVVEVFPKQDELRDGGLGNLVRLPFGKHGKTGVRSFIHYGEFGYLPLPQVLDTIRMMNPFPPHDAMMSAGGYTNWTLRLMREVAQGLREGERNSKLWRWSQTLRDCGFTEHIISAWTTDANDLCEEPLDGNELSVVLRERNH